MPKQPALPRLSHMMKKKVTRREQFLAEMEAVVPWTRLLSLIAPHYPEGRAEGRAPTDAAGDDAAGPLPAELVCVERPDGGGDAL
jgi:hypothetical protein